MRDFSRIKNVCAKLEELGNKVPYVVGNYVSVAILNVTPFWIAALSARLSHESWDRMDMGEADIDLMRRLYFAGDEHAKGLRGLKFTLLIEATRYFWVEMDTYRVGIEGLGSTSTMHKEAKRLRGDDLVKAKEALSEGTLQLRCREFSMPALIRIIDQRQNHRLPDWQEFVKIIGSAPEMMF